MPIPLILDVDTGVDDAFALLFAVRHPGLDLRAVTCVAGNTALANVVANTLTVLDAAGADDVLVGRGADRPLLAPAERAGHVHGVDGLGGLAAPSDRAVAPIAAVELLRDELERAIGTGERITLVPLGPQTNIALLLRSYPHVAAGIERVVFMGGSASGGNATAVAEFNIFHDPEAAAIVFAACRELSVPMTMYGLDVFSAVTVDHDDVRVLRSSPDAAAQLAAGLLEHQQQVFGREAVTIGDAGAVCAVVDPGGIRTERHPVQVVLAPGVARGQTLVDRRTWAGDLGAPGLGSASTATPVDVALDVDAGRYASLWLTAVAGR